MSVYDAKRTDVLTEGHSVVRINVLTEGYSEVFCRSFFTSAYTSSTGVYTVVRVPLLAPATPLPLILRTSLI